MKSDQWKKLDALMGQVLERPREERTAFLEEFCGDDRELLAEARSLLAADDEATSFFTDEPAAQDPREARIGREIGHYRLLEVIGEGGMGTVYKAERSDGAFDKQVALKLLKPGTLSDHWRQRFRTERHILGRLDHPHIATLLDGGNTDDDEPYLVMELVEGRPIDRYCREEKLSVKERIVLLEKVCGAVAFAHQNLVVHRDLKPGNVLVNDQGEPRLLDFGIAKLLEPDMLDLTVEATQTHLRPMSPNHASPEQIVGGAITTATDVWALGALTYEILAGQRPYESSRSLADLEAMRRTLPKAPSRVVEDSRVQRQVRGDLDTIVLKALRADPERRYGTAADLAADFRRHLTGLPVHARPDSLGYRLGKFVKRNRLPVGLGAASLAVIVGLLVGLFFQADDLREERDKARQTVELLVEVLGEASAQQNPGEEVTVREAMELGEPVMREKLKDQPELLGIILATIGKVYSEMGFFDESIPRLEEALGLIGLDNPRELSLALWELGLNERYVGRLGEAEKRFKEALAISENADGRNSVMVATILKSLGIVEFRRGELRESLVYFGESARVLERVSTSQIEKDRRSFYVTSVQVQTYLGRIHSQQKNDSKASDYYGKALRLAEEGFPIDSIDRAATYFDLGRFHEKSKENSKAVEFLDKAVEISSNKLQSDHRNTAVFRIRLGRNLRKIASWNEAVSELEKSRQVLMGLYGPDHSLVGRVTVNLLTALAGAEKWREVIDLLSSPEGKALFRFEDHKPGWSIFCLVNAHLALGEIEMADTAFNRLGADEIYSAEGRAMILLARKEIALAKGEVKTAIAFEKAAKEAWPEVPIPTTFQSYLSKEFQ